jgi:hypothetical protein
MSDFKARIQRVERLAAKIKSERAEPDVPSAPVYGRRASGFVQLGLTVKPEVKELLRDAADGQGITMSELLDALLEDALTSAEPPNPSGFRAFDFEVHCSHCGHLNTHHGAVSVWNRSDEDSDSGTHARVAGQSVMTHHNADTGNPSRMRDGVLVEIACEACEAVSTLALIQHKGFTHVVYPWNPRQAWGGEATLVPGDW